MKKDKLPLVTAASCFDAVVLCDGDYPSHAVALSILQHANYLVCCDGAGMHYILHGGTPDAIVGDGDSLPDDFKRRYADLVHLVDEQDDNDQTKATRFCMKQGMRRIAYLGCTGKREDHTLCNISLIMRYMREWGARCDDDYRHRIFCSSFRASVFRDLCAATGEYLQLWLYEAFCRGTQMEALSL